MCGIWAFIEIVKSGKPLDYTKLFGDFMSMKARGPDMSSFTTMKNISVGFHRLAIMDPTFHANQPYIIEDGERTIVFVCNGEIYDFKDLIKQHDLPIHNNSDCMTIPQLYLKYVKQNKNGRNNIDNFAELFRGNIKGEFAFILFEFDRLQNLKEVVAGRDVIGVRPLYLGVNEKSIMLSSEIKGMTSFETDVIEFPPGTLRQFVFDSFLGTCTHFVRTFKEIYDIVPRNYDEPSLTLSEKLDYSTMLNNEPSNLESLDSKSGMLLSSLGKAQTDNEPEAATLSEKTKFSSDNEPQNNHNIEAMYLKEVRNSIIASVKRRLVADKPIAFLLSGGLDSSLVAAVAAKLLGQPINTYCCGLIGTDSTDIKYARTVAKHIKSNHTEVMFTVEEALSMIETVIRTIESYCITSVRASIPQYLVSKYVGEKTDARVIMTGEGSDEVAAGYLYNYYAPNGNALHKSTLEYVDRIHMYDGRRVDRCVAAASCEARIALLDPEFISVYWSIPTEWRMPTYKNCEKWWIRKAFDNTNILNQEVLWRRKEAFSDGISGTTKSWFQILQEHIDTLVPNDEFKENPWNCKTKEEYYYKKIFVKHFGVKRLNVLPGHWMPKWDASGKEINGFVDPSARTLKVYNKDEQSTVAQ
jgi:asparagine synthase (glutamine-hydrolysing)